MYFGFERFLLWLKILFYHRYYLHEFWPLTLIKNIDYLSQNCWYHAWTIVQRWIIVLSTWQKRGNICVPCVQISMKLLLFLLGTKRFKNRVQSSIDCSLQQLRNQILCIENIFVHYALHTAIIFCHFFLSLITDFVLIFFIHFFFLFKN